MYSPGATCLLLHCRSLLDGIMGWPRCPWASEPSWQSLPTWVTAPKEFLDASRPILLWFLTSSWSKSHKKSHQQYNNSIDTKSSCLLNLTTNNLVYHAHYTTSLPNSNTYQPFYCSWPYRSTFWSICFVCCFSALRKSGNQMSKFYVTKDAKDSRF